MYLGYRKRLFVRDYFLPWVFFKRGGKGQTVPQTSRRKVHHSPAGHQIDSPPASSAQAQ
jgi:hypothetical protein